MAKKSVLVFSLLFGLAAAFGAYTYLAKKGKEVLGPPERIIVAAVDISPRTIIRPEMVNWAFAPKEKTPPEALKTPAEVIGHVAMARIAKGTIISSRLVEARGASLGLAYTIPPGLRAITVALDPITGLAGFLKPGDHVDVVATFSGDDDAATRTILQDVELLAIGTQLQGTPPTTPEEVAKAQPQPNATLAVTPWGAERLILAEAEGKLRLVLRPAGESFLVASAGITTSQLLGGTWQMLYGGGQAARPPAEITQARRAPPSAPRRQGAVPIGAREASAGTRGVGPAPVFAGPLPSVAAAPIAGAQAGLSPPGERVIEIIRRGRVERVKVNY